MKIPFGHTESEVLAAIEKSVTILAPAFVFGCYTRQDIEQEARLFALQVLEKEKYNPSLPLGGFLFTHIRNRLINLRRDKFWRNDEPCDRCHAGDFCGEDSKPCELYATWLARNVVKANIASPKSIDHIADEKESRTRSESLAEANVEISEVKALIDRELSVELRSSYLQMLAGVSVPRAKRLEVERAVRSILKGVVECPTSEDD